MQQNVLPLTLWGSYPTVVLVCWRQVVRVRLEIASVHVERHILTGVSQVGKPDAGLRMDKLQMRDMWYSPFVERTINCISISLYE